MIGEKAFNGCTSLSSISLPEGLAMIGYAAFRDCTFLSSISIPDTVSLVHTKDDDFYDDDDDDDQHISISGVAPNAFEGCTLLSQLSAAKTMSVEQLLRWRRRVPVHNQRYAVQAALLRLRTELYAVGAGGGGEEEEEEEEEEGGGEEVEEEGQHEAQEGLQGKLAFDIITSDDVWRHILEFL